ncbi:MAG: PEGA domain-containing protein [Minicystis sp.]
MRTTTASALLSLALIALAANARADEPKKDAPAAASKADEASQRFKNGVAFYKDKDFTAAMVEFKKAYELLPNYNVLFNIGQTARELKDYAAALTAFEQYLREGGAKVAAARKKDVQASIDELRRKVGTIKVTTNVDGAEILVDDVSVGSAPLAQPVVANVGRRKLAATASGYAPAQRVVDVASMAETAVSLELTKVEGIAPVEPPKEPPPKPGVPIVVWATLGATGAAAIVTGVLGGLAVSARGGLKDALGTFPGDPQAIAAAQSKTRTFAVATDVMGGITIAGAVTTAVLFVVAPRAAEKAKAMVEISPMGIGVRGVF